MIIREYLESAKSKGVKLISLKDEIQSLFPEDKDFKYYYPKILNIVKKENYSTERLYSVIHIRQQDFNKILKKIIK